MAARLEGGDGVAIGAGPEALRPYILPLNQTMAKQSAPMPLPVGSTTGMALAMATAASTALPPFKSTCRPAEAACGLPALHMPLRA